MNKKKLELGYQNKGGVAMAMKKSELKPGMKVRNKRTGSTGEVFGLNGIKDGPLGYADWCVGIRRRIATGKRKGQYDYLAWNINNLEPAPQN